MIQEHFDQPKPEAEIIAESDELLAAFERVKKARAEKIKRHYNNQQPERKWRKPHND